MSVLCQNLPELKNGDNISQTVFLTGEANFAKIYQITKDNKLKKFLFKILHRIIITKKELKRLNNATDDHCNLCSRTDSIMHTFLECGVSISIFSSTIKWFNDEHKLKVSPSAGQILFNLTDEIAPTNSQTLFTLVHIYI